MSNGITIEVFTNTGNNYPPVQVIQVEENEQSIIVHTPEYFAPVQSVNGKIGFVNITQEDLGISGGLLVSGDLLNYYLRSNPSGFITGVDLSALYPRSNPSGFITGVDLSALYPRSNPSGFITGVDLSNYVTKNNAQFTNRPFVNGTGILLSGEAAKLPETIVYTTGNQIISGSKTFYADRYIFSGANVLFIENTGLVYGQWDFTHKPKVNGSGVLLQGELDLSVYATTTNLATTGSNLQSNVNTLTTNLAMTGSMLANNIATTGSNLESQINNLGSIYVTKNNGEFNNRPVVNGTGVLLQGEATAGSIENVVYTTGDQTINGIKTFGNHSKIIINPEGINNEIILTTTSGISIFELIGTEDSIDYTLVNGKKTPLISGSPSLDIVANIITFGNKNKIIFDPEGIKNKSFLTATSGISIFELIGTQDSINYELFQGEDVPLISGSPSLDIAANIIIPSSPPLTTGDRGIKGSITWDTEYLYICVGTNNWKKVGLNAW
jgi:hypothetical protein